MSSLPHGFGIYFCDNVLVMLTATTAGTLGANLFDGKGLNPILVQGLGVLVNTIITLVIYIFAATRYRAIVRDGVEETDSEDEEFQMRDLVKAIELDGKAVVPDEAIGWSHVVQVIPWIIIVPMVNIPIAINNEIAAACLSDPYTGWKLFFNSMMFTAYLLIAIVMSRVYGARPDSGAPCESLPTFLLNAFNHSMLSSAGKSLHLVQGVIFVSVVGKPNSVFPKSLLAKGVQTVMFLAITWFLLAHTWPRLRQDVLSDKLFKAVITTITVYAWAFSFINDLWELFYTSIGYGQMWYCMLMGVCLLVALLLAHYSEDNFYGGPSEKGAAFGLMLCWVVDFGVWWQWAQVMSDIDTAAGSSAPVVNVFTLVAFLAITGTAYALAEKSTLHAHRKHRHRHHPHAPRTEPVAVQVPTPVLSPIDK